MGVTNFMVLGWLLGQLRGQVGVLVFFVLFALLRSEVQLMRHNS